MNLTEREKSRYYAQMQLPDMGEKGQLKLKAARVLCVGAGGLGCSLLTTLIASGIGTIGIVDSDVVEITNLSRQWLYQEADIGQLKSQVAVDKLSYQNPHLELVAYPELFNKTNAIAIATSYHCIVDCSDNAETRYVIANIANRLAIPHIYGSAEQWRGQMFTALPNHYAEDSYPCYQCIAGKNTNISTAISCAQQGIIAPVTGIIAQLQAAATIRFLIEQPAIFSKQLFCIDLQQEKPIRSIRIKRDTLCSNCQ